jgi:hypothetical protein
MAINFHLELAHRACRRPSMAINMGRPRESVFPQALLALSWWPHAKMFRLFQGAGCKSHRLARRVRFQHGGPGRLTAKVTIEDTS